MRTHIVKVMRIGAAALVFAGMVGVARSADDAPDVRLPNIALPKPEKTSLRIGISAVDPEQFPLQFAADLKLFQQAGFTNVTVTFFDSATRTSQALLAGQIDVSTNAASQTLLSLTTKTPIVDVGVMNNKVAYYLYVAKGVSSAADLKGKRVATSQFGGQSYGADILALKELGLSPKDVQFVDLQNEAARLSALQAGSVSAAPGAPEAASKLASLGIRPLVKLPETGARLAGSDISMRRDFVKNNPNTALAVVAVALAAVQAQFTHTDRVIDFYAKWAQLTPKEAGDIWRGYLASGVAQRDLRSTKAAYDGLKEVLEPIEKGALNLDAGLAYDQTFIDKLDSLGYMKALGVPEK